MALAVLPFLPITLPISLCSTFNNITILLSSGVFSSTIIPSGLSTRCLAMNSTNSFIERSLHIKQGTFIILYRRTINYSAVNLLRNVLFRSSTRYFCCTFFSFFYWFLVRNGFLLLTFWLTLCFSFF